VKNLHDLVIKNAREVVTCKGKGLGVIKNGCVGVDAGKITYVGKKNRKGKKTIDAKGKVVTPGLIDPHTHLVFAGSRENELDLKLRGKSYLQILKAGGGILSTVRETRKANVKQLVKGAEKRLDRFLSFGTTTVEGKTGYGLTVKDEMKLLKAINAVKHRVEVVPTFLGAHAVPPEHSAESYTELVVEKMIPKVKGRAEFCDVFCEKGVFSVKQSERILEAGVEYGMKPVMHADEIVRIGGTRLAVKIKAANAGHLLQVNGGDVKALAKSKTVACLLPGTPYCLMSEQYAPARKMLNAGVTVALSTDLNPNCMTESMQFMMSLACYKMKMTPAEVLRGATINAAKAINREKKIGSIALGKQADLVVWDAPSSNYIPYHFGVNLVDTVVKKGRITA